MIDPFTVKKIGTQYYSIESVLRIIESYIYTRTGKTVLITSINFKNLNEVKLFERAATIALYWYENKNDYEKQI